MEYRFFSTKKIRFLINLMIDVNVESQNIWFSITLQETSVQLSLTPENFALLYKLNLLVYLFFIF